MFFCLNPMTHRIDPRPVLRLCLGLLLATLFFPACATPYLDELIAAARSQRLHEREEWRSLLHYQPRFRVLGLRSLADDPDFFNAPDGATNVQGELEATLAAFFSDTTETETRQNPQCRFIARYHWLSKELAFDPARLPPQPCKRFANWRAELKPRGAALVFPAAYLNNPASMYGHTFLRIDSQGQTERSRLLAYAINYAAATDESNGIVFAVRGLLGGYDGNFSMSPYYAKVGEYNDLENRDMWEYELALTPEELDRLLMHAWELATVRFDYYFFDENCSYHLLSLLDVARPGLRLADRFPLWAIPGDTVRAVAEQAGLVQRVAFRPARSTQLRQRQAMLTASQLALVKDLAVAPAPVTDPRLASLPAATRAQVLELAFEQLEYQRLRGDVANRDAAPRLRSLLAERSKVDAPDLPEEPTPTVRPEHGHGSARISLGAGTRNASDYQELRLRPAYHDLLDAQTGYVEGAQIEFLDLALRRDQASGDVKLEKLTLASIVSLAPRDELLKPRSWRLSAGAQRIDHAPGGRPLVAYVDGGAGVASQLDKHVLAYALAEGSLLAAAALEQGHAGGAGASAGLMIDASPLWRIHGYGRGLRYFTGELHSLLEVGLDQRLTLTRDLALRLETAWRRAYDAEIRSATLYLDLHF